MEASHHLIEVLRQHIHLFAIFAALGEQLNLSQHLVCERIAHHETGVTGGATQIHETTLGKKNDLVATWQGDVIHLRLDVVPLIGLERSHIDLVIEVSDVADDRFVLHLHQVLIADHLVVTGGGHKDVHLIHHILEADHPVTLHRSLQGANGIHFSNANGGAKTTQ